MRSSLSKCSMQYYVLGVLSIAIICFIYNFGFIFDNDLENHAKKVGVEQFRKIAYNNDDDLIEQKFAIHHHNNYVQFIGLGEEEFNQLCIAQLTTVNFGKRISDIYKKVQMLKSARNTKCLEILGIFNNLFEFELIETTLRLSETFRIQVKAWLGNNEDLFQQIYKQEVFKVVSKVTNDETIFNLLRSKRPVSKSGVDPMVYVENLTLSTAKGCDFCNYREHTAEDVFGRIENKFSATASNTFKLGKFHGLFFPLLHHPLNISYQVLEELFLKTSTSWFQKAFETDSSQRYPSMLWDSLPHAGASQVHPHLHGILDNKQYAGNFEIMHQNSLKYYKEHQRSLWSDFIMVHNAFGLAIREGNAVALVPLNAKKDHEYWIISNSLNSDVVKLVYRILQTYRFRLNVFCHSAGIVYPLMSPTVNEEAAGMTGLPVIFRIGSRGDCTSDRSDVSSLELYTLNNINTNIAQTIEELKNLPVNYYN